LYLEKYCILFYRSCSTRRTSKAKASGRRIYWRQKISLLGR